MLTIIPAIDIIEGKAVRLSQGDYKQKKIYNEDPLEVAKSFEAHGLKRLHLVDLDGAKEKHVVNWKILERIAANTKLEIDFGGGIKADEDIRIIFENGAAMATIGSIAAKDPELFIKWVQVYGTDRLILGADVNNHKIAVAGWLEVTDIDVFDFLNDYTQKGVKKVLCTDISKDGMMSGTSHELYSDIVGRFPELYLIASGGVTKLDELFQLESNKISAAIIGKAIYEGSIALSELEKLVLTPEFN